PTSAPAFFHSATSAGGSGSGAFVGGAGAAIAREGEQSATHASNARPVGISVPPELRTHYRTRRHPATASGTYHLARRSNGRRTAARPGTARRRRLLCRTHREKP